MTLKIKLLIITIVLVVAGYFTWQTEEFHKLAFPVKFWADKVEMYKWRIGANKIDIFSSQIEIKKLKLTFDLDIADAVYSAKYDGLTEQQAVEGETEYINEQIRSYERNIYKSQQANHMLRRELKQAAIELSKHQ